MSISIPDLVIARICCLIPLSEFVNNLEIETEAVSQINLKMKSGLLIQLHLDYLRPNYGRGTEVVCEKGIVFWDYLSGKLTIEDNKNSKSLLHCVDENFERN